MQRILNKVLDTLGIILIVMCLFGDSRKKNGWWKYVLVAIPLGFIAWQIFRQMTK